MCDQQPRRSSEVKQRWLHEKLVGEKAETRKWGVCLHTLLQKCTVAVTTEAGHEARVYLTLSILCSQSHLVMDVTDMQVCTQTTTQQR